MNPGTLVAVVALVFALAGSAIALPGKNNVDKNDIKKGAVKAKAIKKGAVKRAKIANNAVDSSKIADGSVAEVDLAGDVAAKLNATEPHAHGYVRHTGALERAVNVASVTNPSTGVYCIEPAAGSGIDPATAVVTVGSNGAAVGGTNLGNVTVQVTEWQPLAPGCPDGTFQVDTFLYDGDGTDNNDGGGDTDGDDLDQANLGFAFEIHG